MFTWGDITIYIKNETYKSKTFVKPLWAKWENIIFIFKRKSISNYIKHVKTLKETKRMTTKISEKHHKLSKRKSHSMHSTAPRITSLNIFYLRQVLSLGNLDLTQVFIYHKSSDRYTTYSRVLSRGTATNSISP